MCVSKLLTSPPSKLKTHMAQSQDGQIFKLISIQGLPIKANWIMERLYVFCSTTRLSNKTTCRN